MLLRSELLDRMEILFPDQPIFTDLRRAYIDRDMSSLFRLLANNYGEDADQIRKAVMEGNLHAIFRVFESGFNPVLRDSSTVFDTEDLRKAILEDNIWSMFRLLLAVSDSQIIHAIKSMYASGIRWDRDAMSQGQLKSKMWAIDELKRLDLDLGTVFLCAGWYGILATLMFEHNLKLEKIRSFDIDPDVRQIAEKFNLPWVQADWKFKSVYMDIHKMDYVDFEYTIVKSNGAAFNLTDTANTVINTSCEHIEHFDEWYERIPSGMLLVLQSNDFQDVQEHVNTSTDYNNFADKTPMAEVLYGGELNLPAYNRFMRIGRK